MKSNQSSMMPLFKLTFPLFVFYFIVFNSYASNQGNHEQKNIHYNFNIAFENLNFIPNRNQHDINHQETLDLEAGLTYDNETNLKININPRLRLDFADQSRNRYIPNKAYLMFYGTHFELSAGLMIKNWGVASFFNPTDILNRKDLEDNAYTPETLGEVMVSARGMLSELGPLSNLYLEAIILPYFQKAHLPQNNTRFAIKGTSGLIPYQKDDVQDSPKIQDSLGFALRTGATLAFFDWSFLYYHGPERNPGYYFRTNSSGALRIRPFYYTLDSLGFNGEASLGKFVLRLETALKLTIANSFKTHILAAA